MASVGDINTITLPDGNTYDIRDTNAVAMTGATAFSDGASGLVPAPTAGDEGKYLRGDGTWNSVDISGKADKADTVLTTTLSRGRTENTTVGTGSFAFGDNVTASGDYSHTEGDTTTASGYASHAEGYGTSATGSLSHAEGGSTVASGESSHAEGSATMASGNFSHAAGECTYASRRDQMAFGKYNFYEYTGTPNSLGTYVEFVGNGTSNGSRSNARSLDWLGNEYLNGDLYVNCNADSTGGTKVITTPMTGATSSTAGAAGLVPAPNSGDQDKVLSGAGTWITIPSVSGKADKVSGATTGNFAGLDANGNLTDSGSKASDFLTSHQDISGKADKADTVLTTTLSRGRKENTTVGTGSFAFGNNVTASGIYAHAEGYNTTASGFYSHAEGGSTQASGYAHAEGYTTKATGECSHSEGFNTTAQRKSQHVGGEYNVPDTTGTTNTHGDYVEIIGNGTSSSSLSNARVLDWDGNERLNGDLYVNCNDDSTGGTKVIATAFTGATSSTAGAIGLVPAPSAGDQGKVLTGAGTWETPVGSRVFVVDLDTVTNTSGLYTHTTTVSGMTGDLKAVAIECSDPNIFKSKVTITTSTDSVTLTCNEVAGTSTVKVSFLAVGNANPLSSTEYAALDTRIGDLSDLTTTNKTSVVNAVNELSGMPSKQDYNIVHTAATTHTYTMGDGYGACLLMVAGSGGSRYWVGYVFRASAQNNIAMGEIVKGSNTTASVSGATLTITFDTSTFTNARVVHISGEKLT